MAINNVSDSIILEFIDVDQSELSNELSDIIVPLTDDSIINSSIVNETLKKPNKSDQLNVDKNICEKCTENSCDAEKDAIRTKNPVIYSKNLCDNKLKNFNLCDVESKTKRIPLKSRSFNVETLKGDESNKPLDLSISIKKEIVQSHQNEKENSDFNKLLINPLSTSSNESVHPKFNTSVKQYLAFPNESMLTPNKNGKKTRKIIKTPSVITSDEWKDMVSKKVDEKRAKIEQAAIKRKIKIEKQEMSKKKKEIDRLNKEEDKILREKRRIEMEKGKALKIQNKISLLEKKKYHGK